MRQMKSVRWLALVGRLCLVMVFTAAPACMSASNPTPHPGQTGSTSSDDDDRGSGGAFGGDNARTTDPVDGQMDGEPPMSGGAAEAAADAAARPSDASADGGGEDVETSDVGPAVEDGQGD